MHLILRDHAELGCRRRQDLANAAVIERGGLIVVNSLGIYISEGFLSGIDHTANISTVYHRLCRRWYTVLRCFYKGQPRAML